MYLIIMSEFFCYTWSLADISWLEANITWREACVINKVINHNKGRGGRVHTYTKKGKSVDPLTEEETEILINLIVRIKQDKNIYKIEESKKKSTKVKVTSKDIKLFIKELHEIKLNVKIL